MQGKPTLKPVISSSSVSSQTITLTWSEITGDANTGYSPITSYSVYLNDSLYNQTTQFTDYIISSLNSLTTYKVEVSANNIHGESDKSDPLVVTTIARPSKPNPVIVSEESTGPIRLTFDKTVDNGSPITFYEVSVLNHANQKQILSSCT